MSLFVPRVVALRKLITDLVVSVLVEFPLSLATDDVRVVVSVAAVSGATRMMGLVAADVPPPTFCGCAAGRLPADEGPFTKQTEEITNFALPSKVNDKKIVKKIM